MRRRRSYIPAILIWGGLVLCLTFATIWERTLHAQQNIQYITQAGTAYSIGTGPGSITFNFATHYPELLRDYRVDWLYSLTPGWSRQSLSYDTPYTSPFLIKQRSGPPRPKIVHIAPPLWNHHSLGFDCDSRSIPLASAGLGATCRNRFLTLPLWFLMLMTATPSFVWIYFRLRQ